MQSGNYHTQKWKLDYENSERWQVPLMGWTSTGNPLSSNLYFTSKEVAIKYCEHYGLAYQVDEPQERKKHKLHKLTWSDSWSKRARVGSK